MGKHRNPYKDYTLEELDAITRFENPDYWAAARLGDLASKVVMGDVSESEFESEIDTIHHTLYRWTSTSRCSKKPSATD